MRDAVPTECHSWTARSCYEPFKSITDMIYLKNNNINNSSERKNNKQSKPGLFKKKKKKKLSRGSLEQVKKDNNINNSSE